MEFRAEALAAQCEVRGLQREVQRLVAALAAERLDSGTEQRKTFGKKTWKDENISFCRLNLRLSVLPQGRASQSLRPS